VNTDTGEKVGQIKIDSNRLEAMIVEKSGSRLFLNMTEKNSIAVIDRKKQAVAAVWPLTCKVNVSVAMDGKNHRLFVACRDGNMNVLDSDHGKVLQNLPISTGVDDMVFTDVRRTRINGTDLQRILRTDKAEVASQLNEKPFSLSSRPRCRSVSA
jgi:hypothetical protein